MAEPSLQLGNGNWAGKSSNLLAYHKVDNNFYADELTFARASTGTIVNSDGLIEEVPYNLVEQSNTFDTTWSVGSSTINGGQADKDGGTSAWVIASTTIGSETRIRQSQTFTVGEVIALSCYMKAGTVNFGIVRTYSIAGGGRVWFNLLNGTVGTENSGLTGSIESVGGGWYRCSITGVVTNTGAIDIAPAPADNDYLADAVGESIYIQDAQLNSGSTAKTYYPTTTRLNIPRVDYLNNSNGSLLLEPQSTNLVTYSEDFSQWSSLTPNDITYVSNLVNPDGSVGGYKINGDGAYLALSLLTTTQRSIYARSVSGSGDVQLLTHNSNTNNVFTLTEEWQRFDVNNITSATAVGSYYIDLRGASSTLSELYVWGAQATNDQSYPTSYINTSGTTVTRIKDASATTGLSDVIGQTEGTLFFDAYFKDSDSNNISISDSSSSNYIGIDTSSGNAVFARVQSGGVTQSTINTSTSYFTDGDRLKCAIAYKENDFAFYINGTQVGVDTSGSVPNVSDLKFARYNGAIAANQEVNAVALYKTRLTNTELATLTTI